MTHLERRPVPLPVLEPLEAQHIRVVERGVLDESSAIAGAIGTTALPRRLDAQSLAPDVAVAESDRVGTPRR